MSAQKRNTREDTELPSIWKQSVTKILERNKLNTVYYPSDPRNFDPRINSRYALRFQIVNYLNSPSSTYAHHEPKMPHQPPYLSAWSFHFNYKFEDNETDNLYFKILLDVKSKKVKILAAHPDRKR